MTGKTRPRVTFVFPPKNIVPADQAIAVDGESKVIATHVIAEKQ